MSQIIKTQRSSILWLLVKLVWRFFVSGHHLNGQTYNDATFWRDASTIFRKRRNAYTWWRRKARYKRLAWRHSVFWPLIGITAGMLLERMLTVVLLVCMVPLGVTIAFRKTRTFLYQPVKAHRLDGSVTQTWVMRPRTRHFLDVVTLKTVTVGLATREEKKKKVRIKPIPSELRPAVVAELAPEIEAPTELRLLMTPADELRRWLSCSALRSRIQNRIGLDTGETKRLLPSDRYLAEALVTRPKQRPGLRCLPKISEKS